jgi:exosortase E/protease (VPEID-CTERM system)
VVVAGLVWGATRLADGLWNLLGPPTLRLVHLLLRLAFRDTVCDPATLTVGTPAFLAQVGTGCSGYEGIGLVWVFLAGYLWLYRAELRFPRALWLFPLGTAAAWLTNAVRIAALVAVGHGISPEVASAGFHAQAGWLALVAVVFGLAALARWSRLFARPVPAGAGQDSNPVAAYLMPLLAVLATAMITGAFSGGLDRLYPARVVTAGVAFWLFSRRRTRLSRSWSWGAVGIGVAVFALWLALEPDCPGAGTALPAYLAGLPAGWAVAWLLFRVVGAVVVVPLAEELAFRGYLTRRLVAADFEGVPPGLFSWRSFLVSSGLFGALHGRWLAGCLAGGAYALALYRRGRLADSVLAHAVTNALLAAYVLGTGAWSLWC